MACNYSVGLKGGVFVDQQSALTTGGDPLVTDAIEARLSIEPVYASRPGEDAYGGRGAQRTTRTTRGPHPFTLTSEMIPSGTGGSAWPISPLFDAMFAKTDRDAIAIDGTPTVDNFSVVAGSLAAGDLILVPISGVLYPRRVSAVVNEYPPGTYDLITVIPALPSAPSASGTIVAVDQYALRACLDADKFLSLYGSDNLNLDAVTGALPTQLQITFERERVSLEFTGVGRHHVRAATVETTQSRNDSDTTVTVSGTSWYGLGVTEAPIYATWENEIIKVTGVSGSTLTIVRAQKSTSAASHSSGTTITPYIATLTPTFSLNPVPGILGTVIIDDVALEVAKFTVTINENHAPRLVYGDAELTGFHTEMRREITMSFDVFCNAAALHRIGDATAGTAVPLLWSAGSAPGYTMAGYAPRVLLKPIAAIIAPGEESVITLETEAVMDTVGAVNDALKIQLS